MTEKQLGVAPSGISDTATKAYVDTATPTFDALSTQGNTILTPGFDLTAAGTLEIRATDVLELPATSTLEIPFWVSALPAQGAQTAFVPTNESTTATTYIDLTTTTDTVTVTIGPSGMALVLISCNWTASGGGFGPMSYAISGASSRVATDVKSIAAHAQVVAAISGDLSGAFFESGLAPGITTFKAKYRSNAGVTQSWANRTISVIPQ